MLYDEKTLELAAVMETANRMCAAARTAPKARGVDDIHTMVVTGAEKDAMAGEMDRIGEALNAPSFIRDAKNIRDSQAVVLIGTKLTQRGLDCGYCGFDTCKACAEAGATCAYDPLDQGIALGSAVSVAMDDRIDNRVFYSAGVAARNMKLMDENVKIIMAVPLSVSRKSVFFDRKS
jgi:uncharacterized ferredoxin-like protein